MNRFIQIKLNRQIAEWIQLEESFYNYFRGGKNTFSFLFHFKFNSLKTYILVLKRYTADSFITLLYIFTRQIKDYLWEDYELMHKEALEGICC